MRVLYLVGMGYKVSHTNGLRLKHAALRKAALLPRAERTRRRFQSIVDQLAPEFAYNGKRRSFKPSRLRSVAKQAWTYANSPAWQEPRPREHTQAFLDKQSAAARCNAGYRGADACGRHVQMRAMYALGRYTQAQVAAAFHVDQSTVSKALRHRSCADMREPTTVLQEPAGSTEEIQITTEIELDTENEQSSSRPRTREAAPFPARPSWRYAEEGSELHAVLRKGAHGEHLFPEGRLTWDTPSDIASMSITRSPCGRATASAAIPRRKATHPQASPRFSPACAGKASTLHAWPTSTHQQKRRSTPPGGMAMCSKAALSPRRALTLPIVENSVSPSLTSLASSPLSTTKTSSKPTISPLSPANGDAQDLRLPLDADGCASSKR